MTQATNEKRTSAPEVPTVTLTIDGKSVITAKGTTILEAARKEGIHIPTFCWHPKLKSVGACRICYVEIEKFPKLQVSCATEAMEGMVVSTESEMVRQGRKAVLEFILANHPLDCPTCDKGGECDLQDITFDHGVDDSRFDFRKNRFMGGVSDSTFDDLRLGPEIILNRNRCILCYKCVRANKEAFGEYDLGAFERGNITEINAAPGELVDNPFSGNLVEICPVGALTNSDWRYKIRVWLTKTTPSICNFSSSGSNILFYKEDHKNNIFRVTSRQNDEIDDGWLADITRYGYQIVNSPDRLLKPLIKKEGKQVEATWEEAMTLIHKRLCEIKDKKGSVCIGGLVGPSQDNLSLYTFAKFFRTVLKSNNVDYRTDYRMLPKEADTAYTKLCASAFTLSEIDSSDVIIVFGSDLIREHQNEYLRVRKAYDAGARVQILNPYSTKAADVAELEAVYKIGSDEHAVHGICLAAIEEGLVETSRASEFRQQVTISLSEASAACGLDVDDLKHIARTISEGKKISFMIGEIVSRSRERETVAISLCNLNLLFGLKERGQIAVLARYANSRGAELLGAIPEPNESGKKMFEQFWGEYPECVANNTDAMLALTKKEEISGMIVMGLNPMMMYPDGEFIREGLERLEFLVACDLFETRTTEIADVVLPLCSWAEYDGDYVNLEGRVQRAARAVKPVGMSKPGYEIINSIAEKFGKSEKIGNNEQMQSEIDQLLKAQANDSLPQKFCETKSIDEVKESDYKIPMMICDDPHHSGYLTEKSPSLINFSGESYLELSPRLAEEYKLENGDSVRVESPVGKIILPARISEHIENDVVLIARNFSSTSVNSLLMRKQRIDLVKLSKVDG